MSTETQRPYHERVRTINIEPDVYQGLERLRRPRDSFNSILRRLLRLHSRFGHMDEPDPRAPSK